MFTLNRHLRNEKAGIRKDQTKVVAGKRKAEDKADNGN